MIGIVDLPDSAYRSVDEFIRVAVENQLTMDSELAGDGRHSSHSSAVSAPSKLELDAAPARAARANSPGIPQKVETAKPSSTALAPAAAYEALLLHPRVEGIELQPVLPSPGLALSSFTNRLTPILAGPRVLANLWKDGGGPSPETYLDQTARASRVLGQRLREEDDAAGRRGRHRRSTAWPVGDDESKSLIRYRNCFMFTPEKKDGFAGPLLELGLVAMSNSKVFLTELGRDFAGATSPAIDEPGGIDLLSDEHRRILSEALVRIPGELGEIQQFLEAMRNVSGSQDEVDKELGVGHKDWTEAQVVSHRAAMVGRLRDLLVIDVEALPSAKSQLVPGANFEIFNQLVHDATK